jgi:hypothetical protein
MTNDVVSEQAEDSALCVDPGLRDGRQSETAAGIARGTRRMLLSRGLTSIPEFTIANGRRADLIALSPQGEIWIIEIKSSVVDFRTDSKWQDYGPFSDRLFFAVAPEFPVDILPPEVGLILADPYGAEIIRMPQETKLPAARRKAVTLAIARTSALRLQGLADPAFALSRIE